MAKPRFFAFSIKEGDPVRIATAMRDIVVALDPLTEAESSDVVRAICEMYFAAPRPPPTAPPSGKR